MTCRSLSIENMLNMRRRSPHHLFVSLGVSLTADLGFKPDDKGKDGTKDSELTELRLYIDNLCNSDLVLQLLKIKSRVVL